MSEAAENAAFERILEFLRQARGFDFTAYKRTSLMRRVLKRMDTIQVHGFDAYLDYLQVHTDEFPELFNTILINVTGFFRDPDVWDGIRETVVPAILEVRPPESQIRIWSAGAASGQEAYGAAIVFAEAMGLDAYRERVKIYATDVDEHALGEARRAIYSAKQVADVPDDIRAKYFDVSGESFALKREVRRGVIFGRHDLIQDAPISRVDLLLCRNTLMYLNSDAQARIMARFFFSVSPGGFLVLGRAEMLFSHASLFQPVDLKRRIFKTVQKVSYRDRQVLLAQAGGREVAVTQPHAPDTRLRELAFESATDAQVVVDVAGVLVAANAAARRHFAVGAVDIGSPLHNLEISYRPAELRASIDRARDERREVHLRNVAWQRPGGMRYLDIAFVPLVEDDGTLLGTRVSFVDVTTLKTLQDDLTHSREELETAAEELQSTNEELETTNEELQSTVEELETTNEELQSTNEELETMNEELQSTNEELQTMNDELRNRGLELNASNAFLETIFTSLRSGVVVIDRDLRIKVWNTGATELWGLRADEAVGQYFFGLDIGLPVKDLHEPVGEVLNGRATGSSNTLGAVSRKGRTLRCHVAVSPLLGGDGSIIGVILLMEEQVPA